MYKIVTGGAGFIGSHLVDFLLKNYDGKVIVIDNLITGDPENLKDNYENPQLAVSDLDLTQPIGLNLTQIEGIYHLASPVAYEKYPIETLMVNSIGTHSMLEAAKNNTCRFLLASTSEICVDEGKRFAEAITTTYNHTYNTNTGIARVFDTFGPRMKPDGIISTLILQALKGEWLNVYGNGEQTYSFCYIDDLIKGLCAVFNTDEHFPIDLGSTHEISMMELAELIIKLTRSNSKIYTVPNYAEHHRLKPDTEITTLTGWTPQISLEEGLEHTIEYFKNKI